MKQKNSICNKFTLLYFQYSHFDTFSLLKNLNDFLFNPVSFSLKKIQEAAKAPIKAKSQASAAD